MGRGRARDGERASDRQADDVVGGGEIRARDYTDEKLRELKQDITKELEDHYVSYKGLWTVVIACVAVGASVTLAIANLVD